MGRQAIQAALATLIEQALPQVRTAGFTGKPGKPERLTTAGAVALIGAQTPDPEIDLNPPTYHFEAEFDLAIMAATIGQAQTMMAAIGSALAGDRTLGGTCDWADATGAGFDEETMTGTDGHIEARCTISAEYSSTNPLE